MNHNDITRYTFSAKNKVSGKKKDVTEVIYQMVAEIVANNRTINDQQELLVDCINLLEKIQDIASSFREYGNNEAFTALSDIVKILEQE